MAKLEKLEQRLEIGSRTSKHNCPDAPFGAPPDGWLGDSAFSPDLGVVYALVKGRT